MGLPLPGYRIRTLDPDDADAKEGEVCIALDPKPCGLMLGYQQEDGSFAPLGAGVYRTGDVATRDADGYLTFVGRADDVFKASDYRISPFELESALIEHPAVAEAAVVPAPDPTRTAVPKAYVTLRRGRRPTAIRLCRSSATSAPASRPTSGCAASSSASCRRRSRARSAASSCARPRRNARRRAHAPAASSAKKISRN